MHETWHLDHRLLRRALALHTGSRPSSEQEFVPYSESRGHPNNCVVLFPESLWVTANTDRQWQSTDHMVERNSPADCTELMERVNHRRFQVHLCRTPRFLKDGVS